MSERYLIVGLGNPGRDYEKTRHNVGFWVVEELARRYNLSWGKKERKALAADGVIEGRRVLLAKPQTYMNLSGEAVRALLDFYKIEIERLIVIHDDLDTPLGTLRLRKTGGHGGQNGVRSIIQHLGTQEFARVRFGIGRPPGRMQARDYVLQPFFGDDAILAQQIMERAAAAVELWLAQGIDKAMTAYNGGLDDEREEKNKPAPEAELALALRAHELAPSDLKPLEALARLYKRLRRLDDAVEAHLKLARLHAEAGRTRPMIAEWEQAVAMRPALVDVQARIARAWAEQGDSKRAVSRWLKLAELHISRGENDAAGAALAEALALNPQHPKALALHAELHA